MEHLRIFIDSISEYPFEVDVLLFMAVCFLVLLIVAYGMGERANNRFTAERNEAFLRKMRVRIGLSSGDLSAVHPIDDHPLRSREEPEAHQSNRDYASAGELGDHPPLKELSKRPPLDIEREAPVPATLAASAPTQPPPPAGLQAFW